MTSKSAFKIFALCISSFLLCSITSSYAYEFPEYEGVSLKITGNISGNYSNNITFARDSEEKIDQFTAMMLLGAGLRYEKKRRVLRLDGQFRQPLYNSSDIKNSSEILTLDFMHEFSKFDRVRLRNTYTHTKVSGSFEGIYVDEECRKLFIEYGIDAVRNDPRCSIFENEFGREQGEFDAHRNTVYFNYSKDFSHKVNINTAYRNEIYETSNDTLNDSLTNYINFHVTYKLNNTTSFFLSYAFSDTSYDKGNDITTDSVRFGVRQYITKMIYFDGYVGMVFAPTSNSTTIDALLTGELDEKTSVSIDFSQDTRSAIDRDDTFENWRINGRINRNFTEDMSSTFSAFYGEGDFVSAQVTDTLVGAAASFNYIFWRHKRGARITGISGYTYSSLRSTDKNREYDRSTISASLTVAF